ncbi:MAG: O-methyltransferase [Vicinamibacterales bacterium]
MTQSTWHTVERYLEDCLVPEDPVLSEILERATAEGLPFISVSPGQGKLLSILAKAIGARRILELGTLAGYSGVWLARVLPPDGVLVTIEADPKHAAVARQSFEKASVADLVDLRVGRALDVLGMLEAENCSRFDFVFIDADKEPYSEYLEWAIRLSRPGALIVADNVIREGQVVDEGSDDPGVQGIRRFMEQLGTDRRLSSAAVQTVGMKGYDGLAVSLVVGP